MSDKPSAVAETPRLDRYALIPLTQGKVAIVNAHREAALLKFSWRAVQHHRSWYAKTTITKNGRQIDISMHRFIARTRFPNVCHHDNRNSLDNRDDNLINMTKEQHDLLHTLDNILIQYEPVPLGADIRTTII
ncbi:hypothetical protein ES703_66025 [subsurface metagenome]